MRAAAPSGRGDRCKHLHHNPATLVGLDAGGDDVGGTGGVLHGVLLMDIPD